MPTSRILVIDDDNLMRDFVEEALSRAGHEVVAAAGGKEGLRLATEQAFDVVVTDLRMAPVDGLEVIAGVKKESPATHCIVMTGYGTIETAIAALKEGASDYILKPFAPDALELAVQRALEHGRLTQENRYLREQLNKGYDFGSMVGISKAMKQVYAEITKVADSRATVLIRGESGTGKELVARAIHHSGVRRDKPFIKVNCAALSAGLLESELFGHEKGAFTGAHDRRIGRFELADTGTLLLDEVSEIGIELQPKLLRALQEREFERVGGSQPIQTDTRIVATTNRKLEEAVEKGHFRSDLFFRLNVIPVYLPPLRERKEDIPALMDHFLTRYAKENARAIRGFSSDTRALFMEYDWPGNVRELQNAVERAVVLSSEAVLEPRHFLLGNLTPSKEGGQSHPSIAGMTVAAMEKELILQTLEQCGGNRTRAAQVLDISIRTLRNKLKEYKMDAGPDAGEEE